MKGLNYNRQTKIIIGTATCFSIISGSICGYIYNKIDLLVKSK
jgi:hypothetical protein